MKRNYTFIPLLLLLIVAIVACSNNSSKSAADNNSEGDATQATVQVPQFSADSAYQYIQTQADFGPRVPICGWDNLEAQDRLRDVYRDQGVGKDYKHIFCY